MKILMNKLFRGELRDICSHEMMNLFKTDAGKHYLYVLNKGVMDDDHESPGNEVDCLLFVERSEEKTFHIIAKATGLTLMAYHTNRDTSVRSIRERQERLGLHVTTKYGGVPIRDLFPIVKENVWVSFKAEMMQRPVIDLYLTKRKQLVDNEQYFYMPTEIYGTSPMNYFDDDELVESLVENEALWEKDDFYKEYRADKDILDQRDDKILDASYIDMLRKFASDIADKQPQNAHA